MGSDPTGPRSWGLTQPKAELEDSDNLWLRKLRTVDELYDVRVDSAMTRDLSDNDGGRRMPAFKRAIEDGFAEYGGISEAPFSLSADEIDRLRSLGYIQ